MKRLPLALALIALPAVAASVWFAFFRPIEPIMPGYLELAQAMHDGRPLRLFEPLGYPALIAGWLGGVERTLRAVHLLCLWGTWMFVGWIVVRGATGDRDIARDGAPWWQWTWIAFWLLAIFFNPYFLVGLPRVSDSAVNIVFMAALFACALAARAARRVDWLLAGMVLGLFVLVRPNAATLVLALAAVAWLVRAPWSRPALLAVAGIVAFGLLSWALLGGAFLWPKNGGYNLFSGNNPFSFGELQGNFNAEYSVDRGLAWCGVEGDRYSVPDDVYARCTIRFVSENPGAAAKLVAYKAYTILLRPNLKLADTLPKVAIQYLILMPTLAWWALFAFSRRFRVSLPGMAGFLFVLLYAAPFALTNADPRFRIPLDVVYAMSALAFALGDRRSLPIARTDRAQ